MKTKLKIPLFAILVAIIIGAGSMAFTQKNTEAAHLVPGKEVVLTNYYYRFIGQPGQEDNELLWELVTGDDFDNSTCNKNQNGCVIKTISGLTSAPAHPAYVPVSGTGSAMTPVIDAVNIDDAKFKNP